MMNSDRTSLSEILSLSITMSVLFAFSQGTGFVARIIFKSVLPPGQYGIFAYITNVFQFCVLLNGLSIHIPIIAALSRAPANKELYKKMESQIFSTSILLGLVISAVFFSWVGWHTQEWLIVSFFSLMIVVYSSSQVLHCMPRGKDRYKPVSVSLILVGLFRSVLLLPLLLVPSFALETAVLVYVLPMLGWWFSYLYFEGVPRFTRPDPGFIGPMYKDAAISYLYPLSLGIPLMTGVIILEIFHGFDTVGNFDISCIPYSALVIIFSGISFVTVSKSRKLGSFRRVFKRVSRSVIPVLLAFSLLITIGAVLGEDLATSFLAGLGIPSEAYWPAVILVITGVPTRVVLGIISAYFQGRGIIRPVGIISIAWAVLLLPVQVYLGTIYSIIGVIIAISLVDIILIVSLLVYGYRTQMETESPRE